MDQHEIPRLWRGIFLHIHYFLRYLFVATALKTVTNMERHKAKPWVLVVG
jgi:hypothetical protein